MRGDRSASQPRWTMVVRNDGRQEGLPFPGSDRPAVFYQVADPIKVDERIAFAGKLTDGPDWATWNSPRPSQWVLFIAQDRQTFEAHPMPDRLAVEQQLARLAAGLKVQEEQVILEQRSRVIRPADDA